MSSIHAEFHLGHEVPRTKDPNSRLCFKVTTSKKWCFLNWEFRNSMDVSTFLWYCLAALCISLPSMIVCFQNMLFVIWCVWSDPLVHVYTRNTLLSSPPPPQKAGKIQREFLNIVSIFFQMWNVFSRHIILLSEMHILNLLVLSFLLLFTSYKFFSD